MFDKVIKISSKKIYAEINPNAGGAILNISSFKNLHNWVWLKSKNFIPDLNKSYDEQWNGGLEELYPCDFEEQFEIGIGPDHGELWSARWDILEKDSDYCLLETKGTFTKSKISKKISIIDNTVQVEYKIFDTIKEPFLFKPHLAFNLELNPKLEIGKSNFQKVEESFGNISNPELHFKNYLKKNTNDFGFFYVNNYQIPITLNKPEIGESIELRFSEENLRYFWIFLTQGGWMKKNVCVLEPCSNKYKSIVKTTSNSDFYWNKVGQNFECSYSISVVND